MHTQHASTPCKRPSDTLPACAPRAGIGLAARHATDTSIATVQVANTGLLSLSYLQRVNEKVRGWGVRAPMPSPRDARPYL